MIEYFIDKNPYLNGILSKVDNYGNSAGFGKENSAVRLQSNFS